MRKLFICMAVMLAGAFGAAAQDWSVTVGNETMTQYLWRGMALTESPTIVPTVTLGYEKDDFSFEIGYCSITELQKSHYLEMDSWAAVTFKGITFMAQNYGCGNNLTIGGYDDQLELSLSYELPFEFLPATFSWNTFVLGDYNEDDARAFSSYAEISLPYQFGNFGIAATVGASPFRSDNVYGNDKFALTNLSLMTGYNFSIGENCELPLFAHYTYNPLFKQHFVMLGCSISYTFGL